MDTAVEYMCPVCHNMGFFGYEVPYDHPKFGKVYPCDDPNCVVAQQNRRRLWELRLQSSRILSGWQQMTFESFKKLTPAQLNGKIPALKAAELFLESPRHKFSAADVWKALGKSKPDADTEPKNWLIFYGPVGTGKTGLMTALAKMMLDRGEQVLVCRFWDMLDEIYKDYKRPADYDFTTHGYALDLFKRAKVLYIDEAVTAKVTDHREDLMEAVIRHRYNDDLPTLFTVNTNMKQFSAVWHERISSVVRAKAHWVEMGGERLRVYGETITFDS